MNADHSAYSMLKAIEIALGDWCDRGNDLVDSAAQVYQNMLSLERENDQLQHDLDATRNERTFVQNDLDDAEEEIKRLKKRAGLWDALESQLKLYQESYSDLHNEDHPYIPKMLDLMATLAEYRLSD